MLSLMRHVWPVAAIFGNMDLDNEMVVVGEEGESVRMMKAVALEFIGGAGICVTLGKLNNFSEPKVGISEMRLVMIKEWWIPMWLGYSI